MSLAESQDWRTELHNIFERSLVYQKLIEKLQGDHAQSSVLATVEEICYDAYNRTKLVIKHMDQYTLHDSDHLGHVLTLMYKLMPKDTLNTLSAPELMLLVLTAFCHDIGMAPSEEEVITWNKIWDTTPSAYNSETFERFKKFSYGYPELNDKISQLTRKGNHTDANLLKKHLISEYIRSTHAERSREIVDKEWNGKIKYKDTDLTPEFAQLCFSHNSDAASLLEMDSSFLVGESLYVCLPFIGVILRLADILDFDGKRTPQVLFAHLAIRNPISLREWQKHRSVDAWDISSSNIRYSAKCEHPAIELSIYQFCDIIDSELASCNTILNKLSDSVRNPFPQYYKFGLPLKVDRSKIGPKKNPANNKPIYNYNYTQFNLNKNQVIELLMGTKLYGNPEVALRELIQNSIDACLLRKSMEESWNNFGYKESIEIRFYKEGESEILEVNDNGTGMDLEIINKFYSKVGTSFYKSPEFYELRSIIGLQHTPISRFGIGVLSCFMVSDVLEVNTRRLIGNYQSGEPLEIIVEGYESIYYIKEGELDAPGTKTKLVLRESHPWKHIPAEEIFKSIKRVVPHPPFPLKLQVNEKQELHSGQEFKSIDVKQIHGSPLNIDQGMREILINLNERSFGIVGRAIIIILEKDGEPTRTLEYMKKEVEIEGIPMMLTKSYSLSENAINRSASNVETNEQGNLQNNHAAYQFILSKGIIALHGIEVPMNLFPDYWSGRFQKAKLQWPFPVLIILDIAGKKDLDLNSARTEILYTPKWLEFEEVLAYTILKEMQNNVGSVYMAKLFEITTPYLSSQQFKNALERIKSENV